MKKVNAFLSIIALSSAIFYACQKEREFSPATPTISDGVIVSDNGKITTADTKINTITNEAELIKYRMKTNPFVKLDIPPDIQNHFSSLMSNMNLNRMAKMFKIQLPNGETGIGLVTAEKGKGVIVEVEQKVIKAGVPIDILFKTAKCRPFNNCVRDDLCADKPTEAGVILCALSCVIEHITGVICIVFTGSTGCC